MSPWAAANPASTAACCPKLRVSSITPTCGSSRAMARSNSKDPSLLPSSTYQTSKDRPIWPRVAETRCCSCSMLSTSLKIGMTTETSGVSREGVGEEEGNAETFADTVILARVVVGGLRAAFTNHKEGQNSMCRKATEKTHAEAWAQAEGSCGPPPYVV